MNTFMLLADIRTDYVLLMLGDFVILYYFY